MQISMILLISYLKKRIHQILHIICFQALETMLYSIDYVNEVMVKRGNWIRGLNFNNNTF